MENEGIEIAPKSRLRAFIFIAGFSLISDTKVLDEVTGAATRVVERGPGAAISGTGTGIDAFFTAGITGGGAAGLDEAVFLDANSLMRKSTS